MSDSQCHANMSIILWRKDWYGSGHGCTVSCSAMSCRQPCCGAARTSLRMAWSSRMTFENSLPASWEPQCTRWSCLRGPKDLSTWCGLLVACGKMARRTLGNLCSTATTPTMAISRWNTMIGICCSSWSSTTHWDLKQRLVHMHACMHTSFFESHDVLCMSGHELSASWFARRFD